MRINIFNFVTIIKDCSCKEIQEIENLALFVETMGNCLLVLAARYNKFDVAEFLLKNFLNKISKLCLKEILIEEPMDAIFDNLISYTKAEGEVNDNEIIDMLKLFLIYGKDINSDNALSSAFYKAININRPNVVKFLLEAGAHHLTNYSNEPTLIEHIEKNLIKTTTAEIENQQQIMTLLKNQPYVQNIQNSYLVNSLLRRDNTSFFSLLSKDIIQFVIDPMLRFRTEIEERTETSKTVGCLS